MRQMGPRHVPIFRWTLRIAVAMAGLWVVGSAEARWEIECKVEHRRSLLYEPIKVELVINNRTGQAMHLGRSPEDPQLEVLVERGPNNLVDDVKPLVFDPPLVVPPRGTVRREINLLDYFKVYATGPYSVQAQVLWGGEATHSNRTYLDIIPGMEMAHFTGAPAPDGKARYFTLLKAHRELGSYLFLRVDLRSEGTCLGVYNLGRLVTIYDPDVQLGMDGSLHILHQSGPGQSLHSVFNAAGRPTAQTAHPATGELLLTETSIGTFVVESHAVTPVEMPPIPVPPSR